jgi:23S rRNA (uracil1939-C5)-methyltransferase
MLPDDFFQLHFESIAHGGDAVAFVNGFPVFVQGGAPDETAVCRISELHSSWARAEIVDIIKPSALRIDAKCPFYGSCGGCNLQHIDYDSQLKVKAAILTDDLARIGGLSIPKIEVIPSAPWGYRNRMQFHCLREQNHPVKFGLMGRKSSEIVVVDDCPIADPGIRMLLQKGDGFSVPPEKDRFTVFSYGQTLLNEGGTLRGEINLLGKRVRLDASVFFQSNAAMLEKMIPPIAAIAAEADKNLPMADLYCGVGTFALFAGDGFQRVDLVEMNKSAISIARENFRKDAEFFALSDKDWVKKTKRHYSFIIADPPRGGLPAVLSQWLNDSGPPVFVYVSCDSAALARDAKLLSAYRLQCLSLYDFYPQTNHIECLAVFGR